MHHRFPPLAFASLYDSIIASRHLSSASLLDSLAKGLADTDLDSTLGGLCSNALRTPSSGGYTRHVAHADPQGRFTIVYLVWPPGQFSPVHGHHTWCAYRVVKGELSETLYTWNEQEQCAQAQHNTCRKAGDIATAAPGLGQIHRLGNMSDDVAISLHVYGIDHQVLTTGVNHVVTSSPR